MKDVICFLNRLDFNGKIKSDLIEELRCIKQQLVIEFGDYNTATVIYALDIPDEMIVLIITNELNARLDKKNTL